MNEDLIVLQQCAMPFGMQCEGVEIDLQGFGDLPRVDRKVFRRPLPEKLFRIKVVRIPQNPVRCRDSQLKLPDVADIEDRRYARIRL